MNFMKLPKVVLFDLDGTILDTENLYLNLMLQYNHHKNIFISKKFYIENFLGKSKDVISSIMEKVYNNQYNKDDYWKGLLEYRNNYIFNHKISVKEGFYELIEYLQSEKCYIGLVTSNSLELVQLLLKQAGIDINIFNSIICREDVKYLKPHPDLYEYAISQLGVEKNDVVAIEDSSVGIQAALNANINVIHVNDIEKISKHLEKQCVVCVKSLYDIMLFYKGGRIYGNNKS